jgi:hypothetical protein
MRLHYIRGSLEGFEFEELKSLNLCHNDVQIQFYKSN